MAKNKFEEETTKPGPALQRPIVSRSGAYGDFDNDDDLDLLITVNNGPDRLLCNENVIAFAALIRLTVGNIPWSGICLKFICISSEQFRL